MQARLLVIFALFVVARCDDDKGNTTNPRYGLIAPSLGVPPVPGASYGGGPGPSNPGLVEGPGPGPGYGGGNPHPVKPITACTCTPVSYCQSAPIKEPHPGPDYGNKHPPPPPPPAPTPGYGGGNPPPGPDPGYGPGPQPGPGPDNGYGPGPQPGPGPDNGYGPGPQPGPGPDNGYGPGDGGVGPVPGPSQPGYGPDGNGFDGTGLLDIRIVNKPPKNVACGPGEVYCCPGTQPNPGPGHTGGCGTRQFIDVPNYPTEYGQAKFGAYPWMAVLLGPNNNYIGAGVLIDNIHILTAAHKVADYISGDFKVRLGEWNAAQDDEPYKHVEIPAARVEIHPAFNRQNLQNDVAIVTLRQPVSLDAFPHIKAACLPQHEHVYTGTRCWVAGFGKDAFSGGKHSYILREVDVPIVDSNDCELRLRKTRLGEYFTLNRKSFVCAGGEEGKDACTGDGGSPLVCEINGRWTVTGLVAWGIGCADYGIPGVYVNVPSYINWIQGYIGRDTPDTLAGYERVKPK